MELFCFSVVDRHYEPATTLERYTNDDEATFFHSLHWAVAGPRFHGCHVKSPFIGTYPLLTMNRHAKNRG